MFPRSLGEGEGKRIHAEGLLSSEVRPKGIIMTKFQVSIASVSQEKVILFLKAIRLSAGLNLKDAKELATFIASTHPRVLVAGVDRDIARSYRQFASGVGCHRYGGGV